MRNRNWTAWSAIATAVLCAASASASSSARESALIADLLARMTLEEKLGQLNQLDGRSDPAAPEVSRVDTGAIRSGRVGSFLGVYGAAKTRRLQQIAVEESRLGIPLLFAEDVIHGFRTIFPVPLGEAATFDVDSVERAARIAAREATAHGLHWTFAPMVDIARDPRWGRIVEGSGEDPYLGSAMAAARVRGFQGRDLSAPDTLLATAKHFVAYGAAEGGRDYNTVDVSARALCETYLPPFHAAIRAGVGSVMIAFNEVAGAPMHANGDLIRGILRRDWSFEGIVVSDYNAVNELIDHGAAGDRSAAGRLAIEAGVDVDMASEVYVRDIAALIRTGQLDERKLDEAVMRVLRAKYRLGLFDDPYRYSDVERERTAAPTRESRAAAREIAAKSLVLLKNDGVLPLSKSLRTIAVVGPLANDARSMLGSWSAAGRAEEVVTPLQAVRMAVGRETRVLYTSGEPAQAESFARQADAVLLFLGESHAMSGEAKSRSSLDLPPEQQELVRAVAATGKPVAAIVFAGRPLSIERLAADVPSILLAWFPGIEGGHAIADALFGDTNPAGRLPVTFPRTVGQIPIYYNHKNTGRPPNAAVENSSKYLDVAWTALFPFGHGLSYTTFEYKQLRIDRPRVARGEKVDIRVEVANTGKRAGEEVVQLYLRDDVASVTRPVRELRRFQRVSLLPGQQVKLAFELEAADLSLCGRDLRPVVEPGSFTVFIGGTSATSLKARFEVVEPVRHESRE